jgi:hypothetical protein
MCVYFEALSPQAPKSEELGGEMPRLDVIAKTVKGRKAALVGPSRWGGVPEGGEMP